MASLEIILEKSDKAYTQEEKEAMATEKNDTYRQLLHQITTADLSQEVKSTLDQLRAQGCKLAIGSASKNTPSSWSAWAWAATLTRWRTATASPIRSPTPRCS